jgi:mannose-6-phosphate isomerase class I
MYPDAAHKPEMVVSLSGFCGFAGFLTPAHMTRMLQDYPQLNEVLGANNVLQYLEAHNSNDHRRRQLVGL